MCRIAGIISKNLGSQELENGLQRMCEAMRKGGPDGSGYLYKPEYSLYFGHRRLSLIDLSDNGKQPMPYQERLWITFNGEIYNYMELKAELLTKGYLFHNATDTEVILAGYQEYGPAFFSLLKGMFAFALFDKTHEKTYLVRDGQGIKPLYYYTSNQELIFASEVKAFKAYRHAWSENRDWPIYFLSFGFIPEPFTTLEKVFNLTKGHYLIWDHQTQQSSIHSFLKDHPIDEERAQHKVEETTRSLLDIAVKRHLIADAPIGVFLSGGIDSSLLSLIANQQSAHKINTVSINFNEPEFSEHSFQKIIAEQINSNHISHTVTAKDFESNIAQIFQDMDQPSNDGINSWFVNKVAKENGLKAVLSGIGADELFGGYPSFKRYKLINNLKKLPNFVLKLSRYLPSDKLKRISFLAYQNPIGEYLFLRGFYTPSVISKLLNIPEKQIEKLLANYPVAKEVEKLTAEDRISWFETNIYMQYQLLKDTDYMSMAHGIEVRVPFLDQDLVENTLKLNRNNRFNPKLPKSLLIKAYQQLLPEVIWNRPKKGFTFPFQYWFNSFSPMLNEAHYQKNPQALTLLQQFRKNKLHWSKLFAIYQVFYHAKKA